MSFPVRFLERDRMNLYGCTVSELDLSVAAGHTNLPGLFTTGYDREIDMRRGWTRRERRFGSGKIMCGRAVQACRNGDYDGNNR